MSCRTRIWRWYFIGWRETLFTIIKSIQNELIALYWNRSFTYLLCILFLFLVSQHFELFALKAQTIFAIAVFSDSVHLHKIKRFSEWFYSKFTIYKYQSVSGRKIFLLLASLLTSDFYSIMTVACCKFQSIWDNMEKVGVSRSKNMMLYAHTMRSVNLICGFNAKPRIRFVVKIWLLEHFIEL